MSIFKTISLRQLKQRAGCYTFSFKESKIIDFLCHREATPYNTKQPLSLISSPETPSNSLGSQFLRASPILLAAYRSDSRFSCLSLQLPSKRKKQEVCGVGIKGKRMTVRRGGNATTIAKLFGVFEVLLVYGDLYVFHVMS